MGRCDVLPWLVTGEDLGSRVLDLLELFQGFVGGPKQDTVTVIKAKGEKDVDKFFSRIRE